MFSYDLGSGAELRLWEEYHAPTLIAVVDANREHLRQWLPWLDENTRAEHSLDFIRSTRKQFADNEGFQAGIWVAEGLVGAIGYYQLDHAGRKTEIGYWLTSTTWWL